MASEFRGSVTFQFTKAGASIPQKNVSWSEDITGNAYIQTLITVGTTDEVVALGDVSSIGNVMLKNADAVNAIQIGSDGANYPIEIPPGGCCLFKFNGSSLHAKALTAACLMEVTVLNR